MEICYTCSLLHMWPVTHAACYTCRHVTCVAVLHMQPCYTCSLLHTWPCYTCSPITHAACYTCSLLHRQPVTHAACYPCSPVTHVALLHMQPVTHVALLHMQPVTHAARIRTLYSLGKWSVKDPWGSHLLSCVSCTPQVIVWTSKCEQS